VDIFPARDDADVVLDWLARNWMWLVALPLLWRLGPLIEGVWFRLGEVRDSQRAADSGVIEMLQRIEHKLHSIKFTIESAALSEPRPMPGDLHPPPEPATPAAAEK
jgi:hypothetical protein